MRVLLLCLLLASCGGSGSVPASPESFKPINLFGSWQLTLTIPECERKFVSMYYVSVRRDSDILLSRISSLGEYPDLKNIAACNSLVIPDMVDLNPYTTSSTYLQFKEFLSLRLLWEYDGIEILEYSNELIVINRKIQTRVGERLWSYTFERVENLYISNKRYEVSQLTTSLMFVKGCDESYDRNFTFLDDGQYVRSLQTSNESPSLLATNPCSTVVRTSDYILPTFFRKDILALEFLTVMRGIWPSMVVVSWMPDDVRIVRKQDGYILGYRID